MLDLSLLKTFTVIAETGSLSRSASRIGLTQAAVSLQVKRLEQLLNQQLLERTGRGVTLTRNGSRLLEHAERILRYHDEALAETRYYQRRYQDLESAMGPIEAENERLKGELAIYQGSGPIEAGVTKDIDERLERLRRITESVGTVEGDGRVAAVVEAAGVGAFVVAAVEDRLEVQDHVRVVVRQGDADAG